MITTGPKTVVDAIADGKKASAAVHCFMTGDPEGDAKHPLGGLITFDASCTGHSQGPGFRNARRRSVDFIWRIPMDLRGNRCRKRGKTLL